MTAPAIRTAKGRAKRAAGAGRATPAGRGTPPLRGLLPLATGLVLWELLAPVFDSPYFPPPSEWMRALGTLARSGQLLPAVLTTVGSFVASLVIASMLGSLLGVLIGRSALADRLLGPAFEFARTIPAGAMVPVAVLLIGYTMSMTLAVVVFTSIWPVLLSVRSGAKQIGTERLEAARVLKLGRGETVRKIVLPSLIPSILLGVQIAAPLALIITLVVEVITQVSGIGKEIGLAQGGFNSSAVYGLVTVTGVIGLLVNLGVAGLGHLMRRYGT